jgi:BASS family bile acid:Na+ symporter
MPGLAWLLAKAFQLDDALALGVALVGCCPGGTASNVIAYLAKGDLALSVAMTGTSTLAAPLATPLLTLLVAGKTIDIPVAGMFLSILWIVILPIAAGLAAKRLWPRATAKAAKAMPAVSTLAIAVIVAIVVAANAATLLATGWLVLAVVVLHNLAGLGLGWTAASLLGLSREKRIAVAVEVGMQNSGLASGLAAAHFAAYPMAAVPGAIFSVWHNLSGAMFARCVSILK